MKLPSMGFATADFDAIPPAIERGESGESVSRTSERDGLRLRRVEYGPGYVADHWCDRGHVVFVIQGTIEVELRDGRTFTLNANMSFAVSDHGNSSHRIKTSEGGAAFIVD